MGCTATGQEPSHLLQLLLTPQEVLVLVPAAAPLLCLFRAKDCLATPKPGDLEAVLAQMATRLRNKPYLCASCTRECSHDVLGPNMCMARAGQVP